MSAPVAVSAALVAAACFGASGALEHRAAQQVPQRRALDPRLLLDMVRIPAFGGGVLFGALGFVGQVVALRYGSLVLVQPLLVTGVLFFLLTGAVLARQRVDRGLVLGASLATVGLAAFLVVARPGAGSGRLGTAAALPFCGAVVAAVVVSLLAGRLLPSRLRALAPAVATAVCYGATAGLVRSLTESGLDWALLGRWELYALLVVGPAGYLLNQNAFQQGRIGAPALTVITVGDPLVSIAVGLVWLHERIASDPASLAGAAAALVVLAGGVFWLTGRTTRLTEQLESAQPEETRAEEADLEQARPEEAGLEQPQPERRTTDSNHIDATSRAAGGSGQVDGR